MSPISSTIDIHAPRSSSQRPTTRKYVIYFITGNPGLIEYYRTFLAHLYGLTSQFASSISETVEFHVHGRSLSGFEVDDGAGRVNNSGKLSNTTPPYGLQEQIDQTEQAIVELVSTLRGNETEKDLRVVLMGHSLGSWMVLEVIQRLRERASSRPDNAIRVVGGVCLFATVANLAQSSNGRKYSWLLDLPSFARLASLFVKSIFFFLPTSILAMLIRLFMSFPADAARVTAAFLKSRHGVRQALHMAGDEMRMITSDRWDAEIWGAAHPSAHLHPRPKLRFLFGGEDHWVANETRDDLIKARGMNDTANEAWKPIMEVDEEHGWPHGFCIRHSVPVAERVSTYIEDIVRHDMQRE
ncbi:hypothetical protein BDV95DRAFT_500445 [Massariosphaeria phaeospora]|uniref:Alpha/Beta hydrolase protein n=1 Tax=Massariosphaeria phaeospora TaxID=100035 RepID=A0A7C8I3E9_9PLEO|nr:hypothetical protein BDV95DRAFT_500445 [Massariosphaeria phaeospora]